MCWAQSSVHICKHLLWPQSSSLAQHLSSRVAGHHLVQLHFPASILAVTIDVIVQSYFFRVTVDVFYPSIVPTYVARHPCSHHTVPCFLSSLLIVLQKKVSTYIVPIVPCCYYNTNIYKLITYPQHGVIRILKNTCMSIVI